MGLPICDLFRIWDFKFLVSCFGFAICEMGSLYRRGDSGNRDLGGFSIADVRFANGLACLFRYGWQLALFHKPVKRFFVQMAPIGQIPSNSHQIRRPRWLC